MMQGTAADSRGRYAIRPVVGKESGGMERLLLRPGEVADALGLSRSKVYALIAARTIPSIRLGGRTLVPTDALRRWISNGARQEGAA
jgi:excisionase family DNA binding protein